jgi:hypothetical protein
MPVIGKEAWAERSSIEEKEYLAKKGPTPEKSSRVEASSSPSPGKRANQVRAFYFDFSVSPMSRYWIPKPPVRDEDSK